MKLSALIALRIFSASGLIVPLSDALSQESPGPSPVLEASPVPNKTDALVQLQKQIERNRLSTPDIVAKTIQADSRDSISYAGEVVRFALRGLGSSISKVEISLLIAAAVSARPQAVLQIVRVAGQEVPPKFRTTIVAAAVAKVPDPYEEVIVVHRREGSPAAPRSIEKSKSLAINKTVVSDGKSVVSDGKSAITEGRAVATEDREPAGPEVLGYEPSTSPGSMTLAEAIVQAALESGSTPGVGTLSDSVNVILQNVTAPLGASDPANSTTLITKDPPGIPALTPPPTPPPVSP